MARWALDGLTRDDYPEEAAAHLAACPPCARHAAGLEALSGPGPEGPLYTPALRARTLAALPAGPAGRGMPWWIIPVGIAVQVGVSVLLPGLFIDQALGLFVHDPRALTALTVAGLAGLGALTALAGVAPAGLKLLKEDHHV